MSLSNNLVQLSENIGSDIKSIRSNLDENVNSEITADLVYTNSVLTRINYISGNYVIFHYIEGKLYQKDYYKNNKIYRTILLYNQDSLLVGFDKTIIVL